MGIMSSLGSFATNVLGGASGTTEGNGQIPDVISMSPEAPIGYRTRELMSWRVPGVGYVQMYINPSEFIIQEKKNIVRQRTKGGFVIQYWGEEPDICKISGSTGTSGVEGINVLRDTYRSEHKAFQTVSDILAANITNLKKGSQGAYEAILSDDQDTSFIPTLASLAVSIELYYQGWIFKGYFEDFVITESVSNGVGVFNYSMTFVALERKGERLNFMPWHRSAQKSNSSYNNANSKITAYSFKGEYNK